MSQTKGYAEFIRLLEDGQFHTECSGELKGLLDAVLETGKKGVITVRIEVVKAAKGQGRSLLFRSDVKTKMPKAERGDTLLYATDELDLQRNDPRQPSLVLSPAEERPSVVDMTVARPERVAN